MFESLENFLLPLVSKANAYLSDYVLIFLLVGVGLIFSISTRFVQVRCFGQGFKQVFGNMKLKGGKNKGGLSSFQALATAIAAQVGTGNIVGASGAILIGGPGAIFWMWVIAFLGMSTIYAEAILAQETRVTDENGNIHGGPVYYIKRAFKGGFGKFLAVFFSIAAILALGFMGSMVQSNSIAEATCNAIGVDYTQWGWIIGIALAAISAFIFLGGIQRIASVTEKIVPLMAGLFLVGGLVILACRIQYIPATFGAIFKYAFTPDAIIAGGIGYALKTAISQGAKRGLFSNEAGMGSTPHAHAQANVAKPHDQGVCAMIGLFIDTFVVLTFTALIVISTFFTGDGALNPANFSAGTFLEQAAAENGLMNTNLAQKAFGIAFGNANIGNIFVAICLFFFAFSTIISWNLFGRINAIYLFGKKFDVVYSIIAIAFIFTGSILSNTLVWDLTDMFNNLMVIPNVIALFALGKVVKQISKTNKQNSLE